MTTLITEPSYLEAMKSATFLLWRAAERALILSEFSVPFLAARMFEYALEEPSMARLSFTGLRPAEIA